MRIIKFKTDINCGDCIREVTPYLNQEKSISKWQVDTEDPDNVLSVSGEALEPQKIKDLVAEAGFKAETLRVQGIGGGDL